MASWLRAPAVLCFGRHGGSVPHQYFLRLPHPLSHFEHSENRACSQELVGGWSVLAGTLQLTRASSGGGAAAAANLFVVLHHTQQCVNSVEDAHSRHSLVISSLLIRPRLNHLVERHCLSKSKKKKIIRIVSVDFISIHFTEAGGSKSMYNYVCLTKRTDQN